MIDHLDWTKEKIINWLFSNIKMKLEYQTFSSFECISTLFWPLNLIWKKLSIRIMKGMGMVFDNYFSSWPFSVSGGFI